MGLKREESREHTEREREREREGERRKREKRREIITERGKKNFVRIINKK